MRQRGLNTNRGQATTELAIMGSVVLTLLLFLVQQGFMYNARQGLEMYTFRQALRMSKDTRRGIDLTAVREVPSPNFLAGISRQRVMSSYSVQANPWDLWVAEDKTPQHIDSYQLIQLGEAMIKNGHFIQVPVTKIKVEKKDAKDDENKWAWVNSNIEELDAQSFDTPGTGETKNSSYTYRNTVSQDSSGKNSTKDLRSREISNVQITFQPAERIQSDYAKNDWEDNIKGDTRDAKKDNVHIDSIPSNITLVVDERLRRIRTISTPH